MAKISLLLLIVIAFSSSFYYHWQDYNLGAYWSSFQHDAEMADIKDVAQLRSEFWASGSHTPRRYAVCRRLHDLLEFHGKSNASIDELKKLSDVVTQLYKQGIYDAGIPFRDACAAHETSST